MVLYSDISDHREWNQKCRKADHLDQRKQLSWPTNQTQRLGMMPTRKRSDRHSILFVEIVWILFSSEKKTDQKVTFWTALFARWNSRLGSICTCYLVHVDLSYSSYSCFARKCLSKTLLLSKNCSVKIKGISFACLGIYVCTCDTVSLSEKRVFVYICVHIGTTFWAIRELMI